MYISASVRAWWVCVPFPLSVSVLVPMTISKVSGSVLEGKMFPVERDWKSFWKQYISQIATLLCCQSASVFNCTTAKSAASHTPNHISRYAPMKSDTRRLDVCLWWGKPMFVWMELTPLWMGHGYVVVCLLPGDLSSLYWNSKKDILTASTDTMHTVIAYISPVWDIIVAVWWRCLWQPCFDRLEWHWQCVLTHSPWADGHRRADRATEGEGERERERKRESNQG